MLLKLLLMKTYYKHNDSTQFIISLFLQHISANCHLQGDVRQLLYKP